MFLIGAQLVPQNNILTSFLSLKKSTACLGNSTLPSLQGVYIRIIIILYNFVFLLYNLNHLHVVVLAQLAYSRIYFRVLHGPSQDVAKQ